MFTNSIVSCRHKLTSHARHAGVGVIAGMLGIATPCQATFQYFNPVAPIAIPAATVGSYLDVTTGEFGPVGSVANPSIGWYWTFSGGLPSLHFGVPSETSSGYQGASLNSPLNLALGTLIGPSASFFSGTGLGAAFHQTGTEIAGFKFLNLNTSTVNYGWIRLTTTAGGGSPAAIVDWGYDDSGAPVYAGLQVPGPTSLAVMGIFCGTTFTRRRRR